MKGIRRHIGKIVGVAVLLSAAGGGYKIYADREKACRPYRDDVAGRSSPAATPDPVPSWDGNPDTLGAYFEQGAARHKAAMEDPRRAERLTIMVANPSCFEDNDVAVARRLLRELERRDEDRQGYWYCWDSGDLKPHRIGHGVSGDHLCTWGELRRAGVAD